MSFYQSIQSQILCQLSKGFQLAVIKNSTDQQYSGSPKCLCLVDHVLIHHKVLPKYRDIYCLGNFL